VKEYEVTPDKLVAVQLLTVALGNESHPGTVTLLLPPLAYCTSQLENMQSLALPADQETAKSAKPSIAATTGAPGVVALTGGAVTTINPVIAAVPTLSYISVPIIDALVSSSTTPVVAPLFDTLFVAPFRIEKG